MRLRPVTYAAVSIHTVHILDGTPLPKGRTMTLNVVGARFRRWLGLRRKYDVCLLLNADGGGDAYSDAMRPFCGLAPWTSVNHIHDRAHTKTGLDGAP